MKQQKQIAHFNIQELLPIGFTIIVLVIGLAYGLNVLGDVRDDLATCDSGYAYNDASNTCTNVSYVGGPALSGNPVNIEFNATSESMGAISKIPQKLGLIVTVILAAVVIGVLVTYLYKRVVG